MLETAKELEVVTYEELAAAIGDDPQTAGRHHVARACQILEREAGIVFDAIANVGLRRADDLLKVELGRRRIRKAGRQAKRARRTLAAVEKWEALPNEKKLEHNMLAATAGALQAMSSYQAMKRLEGKVDAQQRRQFDAAASLKLIQETL